MALTAALLTSLVSFGHQHTARAETGIQRFHVMHAGPLDATAPPTPTVRAHGPVNGVGYQQIISQEPGTEPGTIEATSEFVFPEGSVTVEFTAAFDPRFNPHACRGFNDVSGSWTITGGSGAYTGAAGEGTFEGKNILAGEKTPDGCAPQPDWLLSNLRGEGAVTLPTL